MIDVRYALLLTYDAFKSIGLPLKQGGIISLLISPVISPVILVSTQEFVFRGGARYLYNYLMITKQRT